MSKLTKQILLYILPVGVLIIASIVMLLNRTLPGSLRQIPAGLLILIGLVIALSGVLGSLAKASPRTLSGVVGRREFYGVVAALIGWMFYLMTHFDVWIMHLNSRIDQIMTILQQR